jgi:putative membrane protein
MGGTQPPADQGSRSRIEPPSVRDHLANERTLLAWVRTSLTVIGLGFIVDRLALEGLAGRLEALFGVVLVVVGGLIGVAGGWSFMRARREMLDGTYRPSVRLHLALVAAVVLGAVGVVVFLLVSRPAG